MEQQSKREELEILAGNDFIVERGNRKYTCWISVNRVGVRIAGHLVTFPHSRFVIIGGPIGDVASSHKLLREARNVAADALGEAHLAAIAKAHGTQEQA